MCFSEIMEDIDWTSWYYVDDQRAANARLEKYRERVARAPLLGKGPKGPQP